jgi:hypothetical protein
MDSVLSAKKQPDQTEIFLLQTDLFFDMLPVDSTVLQKLLETIDKLVRERIK